MSCMSLVLLLQLSIKQELKLAEPPVQIKKDKKGAKDLMVCPKKKKRKQRSPAKVQVSFVTEIIFLNGLELKCSSVTAVRVNQTRLYVFVVSAVVDSQHQ